VTAEVGLILVAIDDVVGHYSVPGRYIESGNIARNELIAEGDRPPVIFFAWV
jgi:hypothetical protein